MLQEGTWQNPGIRAHMINSKVEALAKLVVTVTKEIVSGLVTYAQLSCRKSLKKSEPLPNHRDKLPAIPIDHKRKRLYHASKHG